MKDSLVHRFDRYFFAPGSSWTLGIIRLIFFGWLLLWYLGRDFSFVAEYPRPFWRPIQLFTYSGFDEPPSLAAVAAVAYIWKTSLLTACIGIFSRTSAWIAFVLGLVLLGWTHSFHKINHSDAGLVFAFMIFGLARCGDRVSIDALLRARRGIQTPRRGEEYRWPILAIKFVWVIVFFLSGVSKLRNGGLEWITSDSLSNLIIRNQNVYTPALSFGRIIAEMGWLCHLLALGTVVFELAAPLVFLSRWVRIVIASSLLSMQIGIYLVMGDNFTQFMSLYIVFLPWQRITAAFESGNSYKVDQISQVSANRTVGLANTRR